MIEEKPAEGLSASDITEALKKFEGDIEQYPPKYSAVRIKGKRLYEYARDGEDVDVKPRPVHISRLNILETDPEEGTVSFEVTCSKGTYIRSICHDLGQALGCGGVMTSLVRTGSGIFDLKNAVTPDEVKHMTPSQIEERLLDLDAPLVNLGKAELKPERVKYFCNGNGIRWKQVSVISEPVRDKAHVFNSRGRSYGKLYSVYESGTGSFLGVGYYSRKDNELKADKIFSDI